MSAADRRPRRVLLVDSHPIVRHGLAQLIEREPDLQVCGEASEAIDAVPMLSGLRPDVLVLDIALSGADGLDGLKRVRAVDRRLPILVFSMHDEAVYAERALRAGANGYLMKHEATEKVLDALRRILHHEVYVSERVANLMLTQLVAAPDESAPPSVAALSDRELEVFRLIGLGLGTRQIAGELRLSVKTVESYQAHIKEKLSLRSARALIQRAIEWRMSEKAS